MKNILYVFVILAVALVSCENQDREFDDFEYQSVYFAHQFPVRTITFGEDEFDTSLDNEGKFKLFATTGGVYESPSNVIVDFVVDNALVEGLVYDDSGEPVEPLPANYYDLLGDNIVIPEGDILGGVEVQLTDAFFNDPEAIQRTYVLPVRITNVTNADTILSGRALAQNPNRSIAADWEVVPKDFTLYALKYINRYHAFYLRRGVDEITGNNGNTDLDETVVRREEYVEDDEVVQLTTQSQNQVLFPLNFQAEDGSNITSDLLLTFDEDGTCSVAAAGEGYTATGTGTYVVDGETNSWGNKDRDALYMTYNIEHPEFNVSTTDTLVLRNRGVSIEFFTPTLN